MPPLKGSKINRASKVPWDQVDWTQPDFKIAFKYGVSTNSVYRKRRELGISPAKGYEASSRSWAKRRFVE